MAMHTHRPGRFCTASSPPDGDEGPATTIAAEQYSFDPDPGTRLQRVTFGRRTVLVDRNHHGAVVLAPPSFTTAAGENPVVGLDATGRRQLWQLAIGQDVRVRDIHDDARERRAFLRDVYGLRIVQTSEHINSYEGDPSGKNFDDDVAVVRRAGEAYGGVALEEGARLNDAPAVVTTKVAEETVDDLHDAASEIAHYGDVTGSERLADRRLAALVGCQHYGDQFVERWAAFAGEAVTRTGRGTRLDYGSDVANTALRHMREDQVMQAALRFGRDTDGAVVLVHTAALRDDLPVVGRGEVMRTFTGTAQAVAEVVAGMVGRRFTSRDVRDRLEYTDIDVSARTVRRVLAEFADAGYLDREDRGAGRAHEYWTLETPPDATVELPDEPELGTTEDDTPGQSPIGVSYTVAVRGPNGTSGDGIVRQRPRAPLAPPERTTGAAPPG